MMDKIVIGSVLFIVVLTGVYVGVGSQGKEQGKQISFTDKNRIESQEYWSAKIKKSGPEKVYKEFLEINKDNDESIQHGNAHTFGGVLYEEIGKEGLSICDSSFSFGCYHEFLGTAIIFYRYGIAYIERRF